MSWTIILLLILIGMAFLLLEILVLPGTNVAGFIGFILLVVGIWQAYAAHGRVAGHVTLAACLVVTLGLLYFTLKSRTWNRAMLHKEIDGRVNVVDADKVKAGDTGKTVSRLAPMGKALINGDYYEVSTIGEFIDQEKDIVVIKIEQSKILVKQI